MPGEISGSVYNTFTDERWAHKVLPWTPRDLFLNVPVKTRIVSSIYKEHKYLLLKRKIKDDHFPIAYSWWVIKISSFSVQFSSVAQSCPTLWPHRLQHARPPCPSSTPGVYSNSCPSSQWSHPTISSSVIPSSSCLQSFSASGSFPMSQFFTSGGQNIGASASASVLPMNIQDWSPLEWTGSISLQSKGLSRVFSNTTVQKHQFFSVQLSL